MLVTLLGIETAVRLVQRMKALFPMPVTLLGMSIDVRPMQWEKAELPIPVTLLGMVVSLQPTISVLDTVSIMELLLFLES